MTYATPTESELYLIEEPSKMARLFEYADDILDQHGWTKGAFGTKADGFCALGAIREVSNDQLTPWYLVFNAEAVLREDPDRNDVVGWNDSPLRRKRDVQRKFRKLARRCRALARAKAAGKF